MISVCIITRDEEEKLNRCLNSLKKYPVEIVVVDTGSKDGTLDMLNKWKEDKSKKFELVIGNFKWCDDFSKARNYAASLAKNDIIFVVDSDDVVEEMDLDSVVSALKSNPKALGQVLIKNKSVNNGQENFRMDKHCRIYNKLYNEYVNPIHEQLMPIKISKKIFLDVKIVMIHDGYVLSVEGIKKKQQRNIEIINKALKEENSQTPYLYYQLGKSYYVLGAFEKASEYFGKALEYDLEPRLEYVIDAVDTYGYALIKSGHSDIALGLESVHEVYQDIADYRIMMGTIYLENNLYGKALNEFLSATKCTSCYNEGSDSYLAFYNAGVINERLGNIEGALMLYKQCGDYEPAKQRIAEIEAAQKLIGGKI